MSNLDAIEKISALSRIIEIQQRIKDIEKNFGNKINDGKFQAVLEEAMTKQAEKIKPIEEFLAENILPPVTETSKATSKNIEKNLNPSTRSSAVEIFEPPEEDFEEIPAKKIPVQNTRTEKAAPLSTEQMILKAARKFGVDSELVKAVATAESNLNQGAVSSVGAIGVMQLMPETAESLGVDPYDEKQNIEGGAHYLRKMLDKFNGNLQKAIAAYNAGPGAVQKYGGVPPYSETQNYVGRVLDFYIK